MSRRIGSTAEELPRTAPRRLEARPAPPVPERPVAGAVVPELPGWGFARALHPAGLTRFAG